MIMTMWERLAHSRSNCSKVLGFFYILHADGLKSIAKVIRDGSDDLEVVLT